MTPELIERAEILVEWITRRPEVVLQKDLLKKGIEIELQAAFNLGNQKGHDEAIRTGT